MLESFPYAHHSPTTSHRAYSLHRWACSVINLELDGCTMCSNYSFGYFGNGFVVPCCCEHGRPIAPHSCRIVRHYIQVGAHGLGQVRLVNNQQIRLGYTRSSLPRNFVAASNIDHINREVRKLGREICSETFNALTAVKADKEKDQCSAQL